MASDDVIELGSSDEETAEPATKKRKPPPNAMVHIPNKLPGVTIKPSKSTNKINPASIVKGSIGKSSVTVTKVKKSNVNPFANNFNGKQIKVLNPVKPPAVKRHVQIPILKSDAVPFIRRPIVLNSQLSGTNINSYKGEIKTYNKKHISFLKANTLNAAKVLKPGLSMSVIANNANKIPNSKILNKILPPDITVKRTVPTNFKANACSKRIKLTPTNKLMSKSGVTSLDTEVTVVDLDDDEPASSSASGPQWYLRPEEQEKGENSQKKKSNEPPDPSEDKPAIDETKKDVGQEESPTSQKQSPNKALENSQGATDPSELEHQNNKEPDKTKYIEITIEDSPIKPTQMRKGFNVGAELAITIEDSPIKNTIEKDLDPSSDDENDVSQKDRNSKKKLEYPKSIETIETVEIEFEPLPKENVTSNDENNSGPSTLYIEEEKFKRVVEGIDIVEIEESPAKPMEAMQTTTPKKNKLAKPDNKLTQIEIVFLDDTERDEFNLTYQSFINLCFQLENSEDMKKIVEKKIKAYYRQVPKEYTDSECFTDMVLSKIVAMKADPEKMYLYIKDVVDELNLQRKIAKAQPSAKEVKNEEQEKFLYGDESEFDSKRQRQIRKLEKTLKKLHRAIQKLEEQEVDFDDEEDSVYLLTERYKERMVRVHAKLCQLTNTKMPSEARVQIEARPGQPKGPAKRLEKWINRKVPIGTPLPFPDFHDVLRCVRDANQEDKLGWNEADIMEEARDLFTRCGKKLQRRRQENEWRLAASRIPADVVDPAEDSVDLKRKLEENRRVAAKKETEVFNKYADRQNLLKLEAVEIGDKEAEESPVESDDEPVEDSDSLIDKEKRKECLKRLLQEKSKKANNKIENLSKDQPVKSENSQNDESTQESNEAKSSTKDDQEKRDTENKDKDLNPKPDTADVLVKDAKATEDKEIESDSNNKNEDENTQHSDKVHSLSDDSNQIDSDIDELHLLQKLYSENELNTSVMDSSDSSSPIAISDTSSAYDKTSSDDRRTKNKSSDVISIENSSYSESEEKKGDSVKDTETDVIPTEIAEKTTDVNMDLECSNDGAGKKTNNEEYNGCLEDILLASSDEGDDTELRKNNDPKNGMNETCVNLRDDSISIGDTVIEESRQDNGSGEDSRSDSSDKNRNIDSSSVEGMEIDPTEVNSEDRNYHKENNVQTTTLKSKDDESKIDTTISIISPESNEEGNAVETMSIKSVDTIEDDNINEKINIQSVEDNNENETSEDVENINKTRNIKSDETDENTNINEKSKIQPFVDNNATKKSVNSIETIDNKEKTSSQCTESEIVGNGNIVAIKSVETVKENTVIEISGVSLKKDIEVAKTTLQYTEGEIVRNDNEIDIKSGEIVEDDTITENNRDSLKKKEVAMDIEENTGTEKNKVVEKIKQNHDSVTESMDVEDCL